MLELGCGTGNYSFIFRDHGFEVLGIDASEEMISLANFKKSSLGHKNIDFEKCNSEDFHTNLEWDLAFPFFMLGYQVSDTSLLRLFRPFVQVFEQVVYSHLIFVWSKRIKKGCTPNEIRLRQVIIE